MRLIPTDAVWEEIPFNTAPNSRAQRVTLSWRCPSKGNPGAGLTISAPTLQALGWTKADAELRVRVDHAATEGMLRLVPQAKGGRKVALRTGCGSFVVPLPHVESGPRKAEPMEHQAQGGVLYLWLPDWARAQPPVRPATPVKPLATTDDETEAKGDIRAGKTARWVAEEYGVPIATASRWVDEVRAERKRAA